MVIYFHCDFVIFQNYSLTKGRHTLYLPNGYSVLKQLVSNEYGKVKAKNFIMAFGIQTGMRIWSLYIEDKISSKGLK